MKWNSASEIVCGFVLKDKIDPAVVNITDVYPAYQHIIAMKREGAEMTEIVQKDFSAVDACLEAAERVNGTLKAPLDYLKILKETANAAVTAVDTKKILTRLENGEAIDPVEFIALADKIEKKRSGWVPMSTVEPQEVKFVKTGFEPIDKHTGGIPYACVTIIGATPGIGKTTLGLQILSGMLRLPANKKKKVAIISLEMTMGQIHQRYIETSDLTKAEKERVLLSRTFNIYEIVASVSELAAKESLACVMIDFADLIVEGEQTESAMGIIYKNLELLATKTEVPIILIAQLSREQYKGGLPKIHHIRYSGLAEATARLILLLYNPSSVMVAMEKDKIPLDIHEGMGYILVGKSNFGFKEKAPGGILVEYDGEKGWGKKSFGYYPVQM